MYDENIMKLTFDIAKMSKDPSAKVCAIITNQKNEILSVGVNKLKDHIPVSEIDYIMVNKNIKKYAYDHAEMIALGNLKPTIEELSLYINYPSCLQCTVELVMKTNFVFKNIYYINYGSDTFHARYQTTEALKLMMYKNINVESKEML